MTYRYKFKVAWGDCDPAQIVFYPNYLAFMNEAAHGFLESRGYSIARMREALGGEGVPMVSLTCNFRSPMRVGDEGEIETRVTSMGRSSLKFSHVIFCDEVVIAEAEETRVFSGRRANGQLGGLEIPQAMRQALTLE